MLTIAYFNIEFALLKLHLCVQSYIFRCNSKSQFFTNLNFQMSPFQHIFFFIFKSTKFENTFWKSPEKCHIFTLLHLFLIILKNVNYNINYIFRISTNLFKRHLHFKICYLFQLYDQQINFMINCKNLINKKLYIN